VAAPSVDYSATDRYCAEELLILLVNFMKIMKLEQAILPNPCLEEEEDDAAYIVLVCMHTHIYSYKTFTFPFVLFSGELCFLLVPGF
jgi:hypothetical protein